LRGTEEARGGTQPRRGGIANLQQEGDRFEDGPTTRDREEDRVAAWQDVPPEVQEGQPEGQVRHAEQQECLRLIHGQRYRNRLT